MWGSRSAVRTPASVEDGESHDPQFGRLYLVGRREGVYVRAVKPVLDRVTGVILFLLALPVMVACAVAVRISVGPGIFFAQDRIGRHHRVFSVYKFRTMEHDRRGPAADGYEGPERRLTHKHPEDPRLTRTGRFLRKWSLDELPQLWNIVRGDMSLVGPRPELVSVVARYEDWQHARHRVKPGLTGLWQVSARGGERPMHEHVHIDLQYVARVSPLLDLQILARTPVALVTKRGS